MQQTDRRADHATCVARGRFLALLCVQCDMNKVGYVYLTIYFCSECFLPILQQFVIIKCLVKCPLLYGLVVCVAPGLVNKDVKNVKVAHTRLPSVGFRS